VRGEIFGQVGGMPGTSDKPLTRSELSTALGSQAANPSGTQLPTPVAVRMQKSSQGILRQARSTSPPGSQSVRRRRPDQLPTMPRLYPT
jgi:hypothetical protein